MTSMLGSFRSLIVPPKFHTAEGEEIRRATWLELFFDLVYVAAIIELGYVLTDDVTPSGILNFVLLFIPIWWSWVGTTLYANRFDSDDIIHRILVFIQIFAISSLAINVYDGLGDTFVGFAISYAVVRFILVIMYARAYVAIPEARPLTRRYMIGFGVAACLWIVAALLPPPTRFILVVLGIGIDFYTALTPGALRLQRKLPPSPHHLPERLSLFTIIVLGELFLKVVRELAGETSPLQSWIAGIFLFTVAAGLWWLYFDNIAEGQVRWGGLPGLIWLYTHLPLHIALTMFGVGFSKVVLLDEGEMLPSNYRMLTFGAIALAVLTIAILERSIYKQMGHQRSRTELLIRIVGVLVLGGIALFGDGIHPVVLAGSGAFILIVQVVTILYYDLKEPVVEQDLPGERSAS